MSGTPSIPQVNITLANGNIGGVQNTSDGVVGYVVTGAGAGAIGLLQPVKFVSLADAVAQGLTADEEPEANQFVTDFYNDAPRGSVLYLMLAPSTASLVSLLTKTNLSGAKLLVDFAVANAGGQIRVLGVSRTPDVGYVPVTDEFIDSDAVLALPAAQAFASAYFAAHTPLRVIIAARVADEDSNVVFAPNEQAYNEVALAIGTNSVEALGSTPGPVSMGTILAKVAYTTPEVNIGRVKDGPLSINAWYIGSLSIAPPSNGSDFYQQLDTLIGAGYITCTTYPGKAGFYISDDPMCAPGTDDYQSLANGRVIDKAAVIAYQSFLTYLKDEVDLVAGGTLDPGQSVDIQGNIASSLALGLSGNISGTPKVLIDTTQKLVPGVPFQVQIRVTPKGYLKDIEINLGFSF